MPTARIDSASGPVELYFEATGVGAPLVWCHESGHASNLEEPGLFDPLVADFLASVETGRWGSWQRAGC
jgi:hypothetical protein